MKFSLQTKELLGNYWGIPRELLGNYQGITGNLLGNYWGIKIICISGIEIIVFEITLPYFLTLYFVASL